MAPSQSNLNNWTSLCNQQQFKYKLILAFFVFGGAFRIGFYGEGWDLKKIINRKKILFTILEKKLIENIFN